MEDTHILEHKKLHRYLQIIAGLILVLSILVVVLVNDNPEAESQSPDEVSIWVVPLPVPTTPLPESEAYKYGTLTPLEPLEPLPLDPCLEPEFILLGRFEITAYCPCIICCEIWSYQHPRNQVPDFVQRNASGGRPTQGHSIAVDTALIPFGTALYFQGSRSYNSEEYLYLRDTFSHRRVADDRGGAIRGYRLDLFFNSHQEALNWGRQWRYVFIRNPYFVYNVYIQDRWCACKED